MILYASATIDFHVQKLRFSFEDRALFSLEELLIEIIIVWLNLMLNLTITARLQLLASTAMLFIFIS